MSEFFTIKNAWRIRSRSEMRAQIDAHRVLNTNNLALHRSTKSLVREWRGHNLLYDLHIARTHTCDVDFEYNPKWYVSVVWCVLSLFYIG